MQKNWYIIYTRPKCEKKVGSVLTKKKIENFFPLNRKETTPFRKKKLSKQPLFECYVFAYTDEQAIGKIKAINGVINLLYWKGGPAIISKEEIAVIKDFVASYCDIRVEKTLINLKETAQVIDGSTYCFRGNLLTIKNTMAKVNLPSLGCTLIAKIGSVDSLQHSPVFRRMSLQLQIAKPLDTRLIEKLN